MTKPVIKIENLSKIYRLGEVGTGTLSHDLNRFWQMNILGKDDPYAKIGHVNDRTAKSEKGELVAALRDINLEVKEGEVLGIIGKNGAGKSTLLKILSRVTSPTIGTIKVKGRLASLLEVGTGFHPEMTGRENIYMNGTIMGMRRWEIDRKLDEIVEFAGVAKYLDTPVKRYSSGMTVRLGFAIAAHLEPEILVVDEVLAVGDAEFQKKAIGKMQEVSTEGGRTVLFVSHNMEAVKTLCPNSVLLANGKIVDISQTTDIIDLYLEKIKAVLKEEYNWVEGNQIGNDLIKIKGLSITNDKKHLKSISIDDSFSIKGSFIHKINEPFFITLVLKTATGEVVFEYPSAVINNCCEEFSIIYHIPKNLLNSIIYSIQLNVITKSLQKVFFFYDIASFSVENKNIIEGFHFPFKGVIRPTILSDIQF